MEEVGGTGQQLGDRTIVGFSAEAQPLVPWRAEPRDIGFVAGRACDLPILGGKACRERLRRVAEPECEQPTHAASLIHSALTAGSGSLACVVRSAEKRERASRDSAHPALARP